MAVAYRRSSVKFCTNKMSLLVCALLAALTFQSASGFYVPGVAPVEFKKGDRVEVKAVKMTSVITQLPYDYYSLPFCKPQVVEYKTENLGEVLRGDRIVNTPFNISMHIDQACAGVCAVQTLSPGSSKLVRERIRQGYTLHLLVDNLPVATRFIMDGKTNYEHGYKLGYLKEGKVYIFNHLNLVLLYHTETPKPGEDPMYRVVGFEVETRSFSLDSMKFKDGKCAYDSKSAKPQEVVDGENKIQFTYQVTWHSSRTKWASRWDSYLKMTDYQIHWFSIINSVVVVLFLAGILAMIIVRTLRRDISRYNKDEEMDEAMEETGWKLVHGDVFRPPKYTRLLAALIGAGIQIFMMTSVLIVFAVLGMLSPSARGSLMTAAIFVYAFMGLVAGYVSGRLYKTMKGTQWKSAALQTAVIYPTVVFGAFFFLNFFLWGKQSSGALPFTTMLAILCTWLGISLPLVFLGYFFGYRKVPFSQPVRTNQIPRQVPEQEWYSNIFILSLMAGLLPFGAMFIELFFIFSAIWENQFYYLFGFLFLVFVILVISCSQIAIVVIYIQLCSENYHWWWRSFITSGGAAFYVLGYSVFYFVSKLNIAGFIPTLLYFTYTAVMVFTFWLLTATVGFFAAFIFIRKIYAAIKID